jgi:PAS domain S-box-containing protein
MKARLKPSVLKPPLFNRGRHFEASTRVLRWVAIILVLLTYPLDQTYSAIVFSLVIFMAVFNLFTYLPIFDKNLDKSVYGFNFLVIDHVFVLALVLFSGGFASPYYPLFFLLIIGVIIQFGIAGMAFSMASQTIISIILLYYVIEPHMQPAANDIQFIIKLMFIVAFSIMAVQSVRSHDEEVLLENRFTARLESERQRLLALINSLSDAVLAIDQDGKVYQYNAAALGLLNTNRDISGVDVSSLLKLHDEKFTAIDIDRLIAGSDGVINRQDFTYVADDGSEISLDLTISPVHISGFIAGHDDAGGSMIVFRDITMQKSLDEERDEFISVTSHELRTPLAIAEANLSTAMLPGYAKIEPKAMKLLEQSHQNIIFLGQLIQDLANLARAERSDIKIERRLVDIPAMIQQLASDYRGSATDKGLKFKVILDPKVKAILTSEREAHEVLQNFLTNAIKYTQHGQIILSVEHHAGAAVISVKDTGIGISASDKAKVFQKFYRSEDYRTRATGGTGLGLYITRKLVERAGLGIDFISRLNYGSTFRLIIPYNPPVATNPAITDPRS